MKWSSLLRQERHRAFSDKERFLRQSGQLAGKTTLTKASLNKNKDLNLDVTVCRGTFLGRVLDRGADSRIIPAIQAICEPIFGRLNYARKGVLACAKN